MDGSLTSHPGVRGFLSSAEGSKHEGHSERMESGNLPIALSEEPNMDKVRKRDPGLFLKVQLSLLERTLGPIKLPAPSPKLSFLGPLLGPPTLNLCSQ